MKYLKLILAVALLLCLFPMPYGYYQLVRFLSMVAFGLFAYSYYQEERKDLAVVFCALAVLFQPIVKIALGRTLWNIVDVVVAVLLVVLWMRERGKEIR